VTRIHVKERRGNFDAATVAEIDDLSMIGDDCQIKPGAQIINSVLGPGCFVEERARVENSVIWPHTRISTTAQVTGAVIGRGCHIGRSTVVAPGSVLGDKSSLTDYTLT
jgi:NDP-sugar pyrophosphorylase family protein